MTDDRVLALCELSNDLLYSKIPREALAYYVDESLRAGREAARQYQNADIFALYAQNNITIAYCEQSKGSYGVTFRGQAVMGKDACKVELYRPSIELLAQHSRLNGCTLMNSDDALRVHLAHEFFHFLEYKANDFVSARLAPVTTMRLFGFARTAHINRCSEVAAHAFAKALAGLPCLPNLCDYLYLIDTGKMTQQRFEEICAQARQALGMSG